MARQAIKYAGTDVDAAKSASDIMGLVVRYGGERTTVEWDRNHQPSAFSFAIRDPQMGMVPVRLVAQTDRVFGILMKEEPYNAYRRCTQKEYDQKQRERALRIIWRHLKDLIEQQLLAVQIGQFTLTDVFMQGILFKTGDRVATIGEFVREAATGLPGADFMLLNPGGSD